MVTQDLLTRTMVELADTLVDDFDVIDLLTLLTDRCVEVLGMHGAGLMLAAPLGSNLRVMASSSTAMRDLELLEIQTSDGPCLDCYRSGAPVLNEDLGTTAPRWPRFTPAALAAGFRSVSALPMRLRGTTIGALNLFRIDLVTLDDLNLGAAQAFADVATIALLQHEASHDARAINEQLAHALNSRVIIEQAKGMLAERAGIDMELAFGWLRSHARQQHTRLGVVAQDFLDGTLRVDSMTQPPSQTRED